MKVLLLNSPWVNDDKVYGIKSGTRWPALRRKDRSMPYFPFPYEMAQAAAYLRIAGIDAHAKDAIAEEMTAEECLRFLEESRPALTVIEAFTPSLSVDLAFAQAAKDRTGTAVAFCGAHATALPEESLKDRGVDFVLLGEYDDTLKELCLFMDGRGGPLSAIAGLAYKIDDRIQRNAARPPIDDLDRIPCPDMSEFPIYKYNEPLSRRSPNARIVTTRGCPYECIFCSVPLIHGRRYRKRSVALVIAEMRELVDRWGIKEIFFDDSIFTVARAKEIAEAILASGLKTPWSCWMDWSILPEELLLLKKSGCTALKFGIESANPKILEIMRKPVYLDKIRRLAGECKKLGILTYGSFLLGLPGETKASLRETVDMMFLLGLYSCQVSVATPLPGTPFYEMAVKNGWLSTRDWSQFEGIASPVVEYPECSRQDMIDALNEVSRRKIRQFLKNPVTAAAYFWKLLRLKGIGGICGEIGPKIRFIAKAVLGKK